MVDDFGEVYVSIDYKYLPKYLQNKTLKLSFSIGDKTNITSNDLLVVGSETITSTFGKFYLETNKGDSIRFDFKYLPKCYIGMHVNVLLEVL